METTEIMNNVEEVLVNNEDLINEIPSNLGKVGKVGGLLIAGAAIGVVAYEGGKKLYKVIAKKVKEHKDKKELVVDCEVE